MVRIRNTEPERKPTRSVYEAEVLGDLYDPPGLVFDEQDGTVAQVRQEVVEAVLDRYPHFERVEASDAGTGGEESDAGEEPEETDADDGDDESETETD